MSDLVFIWEGGNERSLPQNIANIKALAREVRKLEESLSAQGGQYAHYLGVVQDWATEDGKLGKPGRAATAEAVKVVTVLNQRLASAAAALRLLASVSEGVQQAVEEKHARMSQLATQAAKIAG